MGKYLSIIIVVILVLVGLVWFLGSNESPESNLSEPQRQVIDYSDQVNSQSAPDTSVASDVNVNSVINVAPAQVYVNIVGFVFTPSNLTVKKGTTVVWTNNDSAPHNVIGSTGGPQSGTLSKGQTYSYTFNNVGTFPYICTFHPSMKATVQVVD